MPATVLDPTALESYIPHRGVNMLPDEVHLADDRMSSTSTTTVPADDARGRRLFARNDANGVACWSEPFVGELMALTGVPLLTDDMADGEVAVFSSVARVSMTRLAPMDAELTVKAEITRKRAAFTQFVSSVLIGDEVVYKAEIMSGTARFDEIAGQPVKPGDVGAGEAVDESLFTWKDPALRFIDTVSSWDADTGALVGTYHYPEDHPLVPGHFPNAPLMMGVAQWGAVADAMWVAAARLGGGPITGEGKILRPDGSEVMSVRGVQLRVDGDVPQIAASQRVVWREPVRPGDDLRIEVEVARADG